ncbi:unnamed protein product [Nezara viridula]|uniref:SUN domain-containing protein n=1 Tax=Nezara viridula TaxID=85310 RepID=A0A9P0H725_NEZVI|nr:unnamed protein product [Nezara viridula]
MKLILFVTRWSLLVALICSSCIIFTLATAELSNLEGRILQTNSSINVVKNETVPEEIVSPPIVPPLVDVIHGKVNTVVHEIHGSIEEIPILINTEVKPDDSFPSATVDLTTPIIEDVGTPVEPAPRLVEEAANVTAPESPPPEATVNMTAPATPDDIPSFSEWAKKHMAEAGRNKGENLTVGSGGAKLRIKNYASPDCGAKVIAANPEAASPSAILSSTRDDYMLNPCNVKIWFVVELCEPIQPQRIEIANFELFSSSPQDLSVFTSDRFPSREWAQTSALTAKDERTVQSFQLPRISHFVKYIKVELHSHYGSEHYCPISLFKAYGTSELEVLENVDGDDNEPDEINDEENVGEKRDLLEELEINKTAEHENKEVENGNSNLFGSAKAAVMSIVKKAAEVLVKSPGNHSAVCSQSGPPEHRHCFTPSYQIVCNNCSEDFYDKLYEILCCRGTEIQCLLANPYVNSVISDSQLCNEIGLSWDDPKIPLSSSTNVWSPKVAYLRALLPREIIAALCNYIAVSRKKVILNVTEEESSIKSHNELENNISNTPVEDMSTLEETTFVIQPTKVVASESVTMDEVISETVSILNETKDEINEPDLTPTENSPTPQVTQNETIDQVIITNNSQPIIEPTTDEPVVDSLALDSLFPESEEEPEETKTATAVPVQKESVFVRLANRIKALEVNMSLSSQYLEELSRRYKKQVEELQRTLGNMVEDRRLAAERESTQTAQLAVLTRKVETLSNALEELVTERDSWSTKVSVLGQHGLIVILEVFGFVAVVWVWRRLGGSAPQEPDRQQQPPVMRRHSAEEPCKRNAVRRPSEEACLPSGMHSRWHPFRFINRRGQKKNFTRGSA